MERIANALPEHLKQFLVEQDYSLYTAIDHASWRYIMRVSQAFFKDHAHPIYLDGLKKSGISIERIPRISEINEKLNQFGWRAVAITGFIPPEIFLELLSLQILPIACDMRQLEHIDYTPAPDIVHEAAGHAPILADPSYSSFLRKFGEIARRVIFAAEDTAVYLAVLALTEIKEDPHSTESEIAKAQDNLNAAYAKVTYVSEAQALSRLGWWTTEYGLFKKGDDFLIYGAGLLSSAGESYNCLSEKVKKIPLDIRCTEMDYDVTKPQVQLYYTDDFRKLESTVDELASKMSYKVGGVESLERARVAGTVTTVQTESGFQVSGVLKAFSSKLLEYEGPCQISFQDKQVGNHGAGTYKTGVVCALGDLVGFKPIDLKMGEKAKIELSTGQKGEGTPTEIHEEQGQPLFVLLKDSNVTDKPLILILSSKVISVFGGAADRGSFASETKSAFKKPRPPKTNASAGNKELIPLYAEVRRLRETGASADDLKSSLEKVLESLDQSYPEDWLLRLEMLEIVSGQEGLNAINEKLSRDLEALRKKNGPREALITRGIAVVEATSLG